MLNSVDLTWKNYKLWILIAIIAKGVILWAQISQGRVHGIVGFIGNEGGDTESYLAPILKLVTEGSYAPDYRMPGLAVFSVLFALFSKGVACNIIIIVQTFLSAVSCYCLALIARHCFKKDTVFYVVFLAYAISTYTSLWDSFLLSESLCTSATIFSVYFFVVFTQERSGNKLFLSGLFLTWVYFLRPMYAPLWALYIAILIFHEFRLKSRAKLIIRYLAYFLAPVLLIESSWIYRNYRAHDRVVILTTSLYAQDFEASYVRELMDFVISWGGDRTWWNPDSEMRWFGVIENQSGMKKPLKASQVHLPSGIYTSAFNEDSLKMIKEYIALINDTGTSAYQKELYNQSVKEKLRRYTASVKKEKKFLHYLVGPMRLFKRFLFHSGTYNLFNKASAELNYFELSVKVFYSLFYLLSLGAGLVGLVLRLLHLRTLKSEVLLIAGLLMYSLLLFPILLKQIEFRYFVPAYPFLLILACYVLEDLFERVFGARLDPSNSNH